VALVTRSLDAAGLIGTLLVAGLVSAVGLASAAAMPTSAGPLGAGTVGVTACDGDGFTFAATIDTSGRITNVTVSGIDAACAGATLRVTLANGTTSVGSGSASLPASGFTGSATVSISPSPLSTGVDRIFAVAEGP
jgi:hypothetical protein